jgi:hypothetical protein
MRIDLFSLICELIYFFLYVWINGISFQPKISFVFNSLTSIIGTFKNCLVTWLKFTKHSDKEFERFNLTLSTTDNAYYY